MRDSGAATPWTDPQVEVVERRICERLAGLRADAGLTLDAVAERTGMSRATLSRVERAEASPTAAMLGRLCAVYGWTLSRLMAAAEGDAPALVRRADQPRWADAATGFRRRVASPPGPGLRLELVECELPAGAAIDYPVAPMPGLEQHVLVSSGVLEFTLGSAPATETWRLGPGDCLRVQLDGPTRLAAPGPHAVRYLVALRHP